MLRPLIYVTSGVAVLVIVVLLYLMFRTLYRLVFDIHMPLRVIVENRKLD